MAELTLSDGRKAVIREGKGKDLFWAMHMANNQNEIIKLLAVKLTEIEGKPVSEEELEELSIADVMAIINEVAKQATPLSQRK